MFGIDLSNHQNGINLSMKNFGFGIVKATEGLTFKDPSFESHIKQLRQLNKLIGCYHFARPDNQNTIESMKKSADHFMNIIVKEELFGEAILVLDWEQWPTDRVDLMEAWLDRVYERSGVTPFLYVSSSFFASKRKFIKSLGVPLWIAKWPNNQQMKEFPDDVFIDMYNPFSTGWKIWQFTSNGKWPGFYGRVDLNYTPMSEKSWINYACGKNIKEEINENMKWAVDKGIIKGFPDGTYRPDDYVTRNQLALILKRYYDFLEDD